MIGAETRFKVFFIVLILLSFAVLLRYGFIMLTPSPEKSSINLPEIERGSIYDRNGRLLAIQIELNSVEAWILM